LALPEITQDLHDLLAIGDGGVIDGQQNIARFKAGLFRPSPAINPRPWG
jgi:hypothetical protein